MMKTEQKSVNARDIIFRFFSSFHSLSQKVKKFFNCVQVYTITLITTGLICPLYGKKKIVNELQFVIKK